MILTFVIAAALSATQQASPASAPQAPAPVTTPATAPAAPAAAAQADPATEQVCRRQPIEGSRRTERVCHTRAQWEAIRQHARGNRDQASQSQRE